MTSGGGGFRRVGFLGGVPGSLRYPVECSCPIYACCVVILLIGFIAFLHSSTVLYHRWFRLDSVCVSDEPTSKSPV